MTCEIRKPESKKTAIPHSSKLCHTYKFRTKFLNRYRTELVTKRQLFSRGTGYDPSYDFIFLKYMMSLLCKKEVFNGA